MQRVTNDNFGLLIGYVLPGFIGLWGMRYLSTTVDGWLGSQPTPQPTVSGFLYVTLASVGIGLFASTIRWLTVDKLHYQTGIGHRQWDYAKLQAHMQAVEFLVANQYRYYQFYSNSLVSVAFTYTAYIWASGNWSLELAAGFITVELILWAGSRDTLRNYHNRVGELLTNDDAPTCVDLDHTD